MELLFGLGILAALVAWGVAGWWRYWRAVQAAAEARRLYGAQIEVLLSQWNRDAWAGRVLDEVLQGMEGRAVPPIMRVRQTSTRRATPGDGAAS